MPVSLLSSFKDALRNHDVSVSMTTANDFHAHLDTQISDPVVGAPLRYDNLGLPPHIPTQPTPKELNNAKTGVTQAGFGIATYGTLLIESFQAGDEYISLYPPNHIAILRESDILPDIQSAMTALQQRISTGNDSFVFATGPSATADMGEIVQGVHGPKTVHTIIITNE